MSAKKDMVPIKKILVKKEKKQFIKDLNREVVVSKGVKYYVTDLGEDFHTCYGTIDKKDLKKKDGSVVLSSMKKDFCMFSPCFTDSYRRINRLAQIIPIKDVGAIIAECGIGKKSVVLDAGAGSGGLALFLAYVAKSVFTYDVEKDHVNLVRKNIKLLGLGNIKVKEKDVYKGFDEKDADVVCLDLPAPWNAINAADSALKVAGYIVNYSPSITQTADFVNEVNKRENLVHLKTVEIIERKWEVEGRKVRPRTTSIGHSGFLSFVRKIK